MVGTGCKLFILKTSSTNDIIGCSRKFLKKNAIIVFKKQPFSYCGKLFPEEREVMLCYIYLGGFSSVKNEDMPPATLFGTRH